MTEKTADMVVWLALSVLMWLIYFGLGWWWVWYGNVWAGVGLALMVPGSSRLSRGMTALVFLLGLWRMYVL